MACPLRYRYRAIDRLPERRTPEAARGTVVHAVLERLFDLPPGERTLESARALLAPEWQRLRESEAELAELFSESDAASVADWLAGAERLLASYFRLEDPRRLQPAEREVAVEAILDSGLVLRGVIDRLDVAASGDMRIVDYKTGGAPDPAFEARALFQMKFYALVLWRVRGRVPRLLQLLYLRDGQVLRYPPEEAELRATERKLDALWAAIERALQRGDFRPRPGPLCGWCDHRKRCPSFGGTPPPLPAAVLRPRPEVPVPAPRTIR